MTDRRTKLLWMKDILEHMDRCHEQWEAADERTGMLLAATLRRDLDQLGRLCDSLSDDPRLCPAAG